MEGTVSVGQTCMVLGREGETKMHYVIGDVHGCYDALMILLGKLNLTPEDIVTFVGDFVDREPSTEQYNKLVDWFMENITEDGPFRSAIGNHDYDHYNTVKALGSGLNLLATIFPDTGERLEIQEAFARKLGGLPLYYEYDIHGVKNIVTHSWLMDRRGAAYFCGEETDGGYDIESSIWDRQYSLCCDPKEVRLIHGHTIVSTKRINNPDKSYNIINRIYKNGNNINIDCGCFMGLANRGNLAAIRLEDDKVFYAYSDEDVVEECRKLAEVSKGELKDYEIFIACAREPAILLRRTDNEYINACRETLLAESGIKDAEDYAFCFDWLQDKKALCRSKMKRLYKEDKRFIVWS